MTRGRRVFLWVARGLSALVILLFVLVLVAGLVDRSEPLPTGREWLELSLFPIGMCVGYALGWRWQLLGGVVSLGCIASFLMMMALRGNSVFGVPAFYFLAIPGVLLLLYGVLSHRGARVVESD